MTELAKSQPPSKCTCHGIIWHFEDRRDIAGFCSFHRAAPDLLAACKWVIQQMDDRVIVRNTDDDDKADYGIRMMKFVQGLQKLQNAIAKAEGRSK